MDETTQKVVDGTAWREFCDLLADAGEVILAEGNPADPLDRAEGFRMLTRLLRGALENKLEYGRPARTRADLHLPRDDQDRRREPGQPLPRRVARREVRLSDLGHARRGEVDQLQPLLRGGFRRRRSGHRRHDARGADAHRARRHLRGDHLPAGASRELAALRGRHPEHRHPPDVPRQAPSDVTPRCASSASTTTAPRPNR